MAITVNLRYTGVDGNARKFAEEMITSGTVDAIRAEEGNLRYEYYQSLDDPETILLIDSWASQEAIDAHHATQMMATIAALREKYDLHMTVERYTNAGMPETMWRRCLLQVRRFSFVKAVSVARNWAAASSRTT